MAGSTEHDKIAEMAGIPYPKRSIDSWMI